MCERGETSKRGRGVRTGRWCHTNFTSREYPEMTSLHQIWLFRIFQNSMWIPEWYICPSDVTSGIHLKWYHTIGVMLNFQVFQSRGQGDLVFRCWYQLALGWYQPTVWNSRKMGGSFNKGMQQSRTSVHQEKDFMDTGIWNCLHLGALWRKLLALQSYCAPVVTDTVLYRESFKLCSKGELAHPPGQRNMSSTYICHPCISH